MYILCLIKKYVDKKEFPSDTDMENAYAYFYGHLGESLENVSHKMKEIHVIKKRGE